MSLYTIVFDYKGGTYVSQVNAESPALAAKKWAKGIRIKKWAKGIRIEHLPGEPWAPSMAWQDDHEAMPFQKVRKEFAKSMGDPDNAPTPLRGLVGAWCAGNLDGGLVNLVLTGKPTRPQPKDPPLDEEGRKDILAMAKIIADPKSDADEVAMSLNTLKYILPR